jgi:TolB protein
MRADGTDFIRLTNNTAFELSRVAWSPDGSRIAFDAFLFGNADIYVINVNGTNETQLTHDQAEDRYPMWSPDGQRIGFTSDRDGDDEIYLMDADGTGLVRLTNSPGLDVLDSWRPAQSACHLLSAAILPVYGSVTARWVRP